jgi:putative membrane protein
MGLEEYINRSKSNDKEIWLYNLPNDKNLFDVIDNLRRQYNKFEYTFVINQEIRITEITIDRDVDFSNCIFKNEDEIENSGDTQIESSIIFNKVKFKGIVDFSNTSLYDVKFEKVDFIGEGKNIYFQNSSLYDIKFKNVNFNFSTYFYNSQIEKLSFEDTTFRGNTNFREISFNGKTKFLNCTFTSLQNDTSEEVSFSESIFKQEANFSGSVFDVKANFSDTKFGVKQDDNLNENSSEVKFLFENAKFQKEINFSKAIFYDTIYFSGTEFCTDIKDYKIESINFENAQFHRKVRFHHCKFHNTVRFENTSFNKLADFYSAHFHKAQQFHFTDFLDRAIFSNTEFDEEVQFLHCRVETRVSYIRFESAIFNKGLDISRSNFNDKVNFWNIEIKEGDIFTSSKYADDFEVHKNEINPEKNIPSVYKQLRETYRVIKDNSYKQNNKIEALEFSKREMLVYERELKSVSSKSNNDKLLLLANKVSNNFGTNWLRGILFTASTGIITYLLMLCCLPFIHNTYIIISFTFIIIIISAFSFLNKDIDSFLPILILIILSFLLAIILFKSPFLYKENTHIKDYIIPDFIKILNVIDLKPFEKEENSIFNLSGLSYLFLFIGRIFIGYGYYQTIQAFRKFGKS